MGGLTGDFIHSWTFGGGGLHDNVNTLITPNDLFP